MNNRLLLIVASLAVAFSGTPFAARAAGDGALGNAEPAFEASLIGTSTTAASRAFAPVSYRGAEGAVVVVVDDDGPAHRAGIVPGDVVMRVGTRPVRRTLDAADVVLGSDPGTHVAVEIVRRGVSTTVDIELAPVPASPAVF